MKYLVFIWAEGRPAPEDLAVMQLAAAHPIARYHATEVRPFYEE